MRKLRIKGFEPAEGGDCIYCGLPMDKHNKLVIAEKGHEIACLFLLKALVKELQLLNSKNNSEIEALSREVTRLNQRPSEIKITPLPAYPKSYPDKDVFPCGEGFWDNTQRITWGDTSGGFC